MLGSVCSGNVLFFVTGLPISLHAFIVKRLIFHSSSGLVFIQLHPLRVFSIVLTVLSLHCYVKIKLQRSNDFFVTTWKMSRGFSVARIGRGRQYLGAWYGTGGEATWIGGFVFDKDAMLRSGSVTHVPHTHKPRLFSTFLEVVPSHAVKHTIATGV